jgi:hypothetical protein
MHGYWLAQPGLLKAEKWVTHQSTSCAFMSRVVAHLSRFAIFKNIKQEC